MKSRNRRTHKKQRHLKRHTKNHKKNNRKHKNKMTRKKWHGGELDTSVKEVVSKNVEQKYVNFSKMLQVSCKNPDNCLALGKYDEMIKQFFGNFRTLSYIDNSNVKRIGNPSQNGFVIELPFKKLNYTAYTVLKCAANAISDNLFYEYYVGKYFINNYIKKLPCFVETYDLYQFTSPNNYKMVEDAAKNKTLSSLNISSKIVRVPDMSENVWATRQTDIFDYSCGMNKLLCVLIQHFDNFTSFESENTDNFDNIKYDYYNILYQVYFCLCVLGASYTHYDLHKENVFLYKPFEGDKCILMRYHRNNVVYEFKSEYIVKIIDYGRNYFSNGQTSTSEIVKKICKSRHCYPNCGERFGYNIIQGSIGDPDLDFYWIDPIKPNVSHDLRFANSTKNTLMSGIPEINTFKYDTTYGTPEEMGDAQNIKSIFDLRDILETNLNSFNSQTNNKKYGSWKVAATMDIYDDDREYDFVVLADT